MKRFANLPWENPFRVDTRSLAAMRIGLALIVLYDLSVRAADLIEHYTNRGVYSASDAMLNGTSTFSLHWLSGEPWLQIVLFVLAFIAAFSLLIGYWTRIATIITWVLLLSLHNRNPLLLNGGDMLLRAVLFWAMFVPLNQHFSLDKARDKITKRSQITLFTPATIALIVQVAIMYYMTAKLKTGPGWRSNYQALYFALSAEQYSSPLGVWLTGFRALCQLLTRFAITLEDYVGYIMLWPLFSTYTRIFAFIAIVGFHLSLVLTMTIGIFPWISIVSAIPLLPQGFWDAIQETMKERRKKRTTLSVYYDNDCGHCVFFVRSLQTFAFALNVTYTSLQDDEAMTQRSEKHDSWVAKRGRKLLYKADVFHAILKESYLWWWTVPVLKIRPVHLLADGIYEWVASHRVIACKPKKPLNIFERLLQVIAPVFSSAAQSFVLVLLVFVVLMNIAGLPGKESLAPSMLPQRVVTYAGMVQSWQMFAPDPTQEAGWYIVRADSKEGSVDIWRERWDNGDTTLTYDRPSHLYKTYINQRWRRYLTRISEKQYGADVQHFAEFICREWRLTDNFNPGTIDVIYMRERTQIDKSTEVVQQDILNSTECD